MRYTHNFRLIRQRKHTIKISLVVTGLILTLTAFLGFTILDAKQFFLGFLESLSRVTLAYLISLLFSVVLSLMVTSSKSIEAISLPILDVLQSFPSFALFPLLVIWLGRSSLVTIIILVVTMVWPILFTLLTAHKQIRSDLIEAAFAFGARGPRYYLYVLLPLIFPAIITGSLVAWGEAWEAIIAAEIIVSVPGVGTYLAHAGEANQKEVLAVGVLLLLMLLFVINKYLWLPLLNSSTKYSQE